MMPRPIVIVFLTVLLLSNCKNTTNTDPFNILIISGRNNHEWSRTTPLLVRIYNEAKLFNVTVTGNP